MENLRIGTVVYTATMYKTTCVVMAYTITSEPMPSENLTSYYATPIYNDLECASLGIMPRKEPVRLNFIKNDCQYALTVKEALNGFIERCKRDIERLLANNWQTTVTKQQISKLRADIKAAKNFVNISEI